MKSPKHAISKSLRKTQMERINSLVSPDPEIPNSLSNQAIERFNSMTSPNPDGSHGSSNKAIDRYNTFKSGEPDESIAYTHTFSTFGANEDVIAEVCKYQEDRIRPARTNISQKENVYQRLYQPTRKDEVSSEDNCCS